MAAICENCKNGTHTTHPNGIYACRCESPKCSCEETQTVSFTRRSKLSIVVNRHGNVVVNFGDVLVDVVNVRNIDNFEEKVRAVKSAISGAGFSYNEDVEKYVREKLS